MINFSAKMNGVKFKSSLCIALFLTSALLVYNSFTRASSLSDDEKSHQIFSNALEIQPIASPAKFGRTFVSEISNARIKTILKSSLPGGSCVNAYTISNEKSSIDSFLDLNAQDSLIPASANKYLTAAIVLSTFDRNDTLDTNLYAQDLKASLEVAYLETSADPSFVSTRVLPTRRPENLSPRNTRTFDELAKKIKDKGVDRISKLVIDTTWFELPKVEAGWEEDKIYVGQISAFNIDEGFEGENLSVEPKQTAANNLVSRLSNEGIEVNSVEFGSIPESILNRENLIASDFSVDIKTLVSDMLKTSNNVYAEELLAAAIKARSDTATLESRKSLAQEYISKIKIDDSQVIFENGSGYSLDARISCKALLQIIEFMKAKDIDLPSLASIAGVDGTLKNRFENHKSVLKAKTGTLDNVTALSGDLENKIVFSFISNSSFKFEDGQALQKIVIDNLDAYPFVSQPKL